MQHLGALPWGERVRWVPRENLHLTLRFLGQTPQERVEPLRQALSSGLARVSAFDAVIRGVELFPSARSARIVATRLDPDDRLSRLAERVENAAVAAGFAPDSRPLRAHVTLGRVKKPPLRGVAVNDGEPALPMPARHVVLYRSDSGARGVRYSELFRVALA